MVVRALTGSEIEFIRKEILTRILREDKSDKIVEKVKELACPQLVNSEIDAPLVSTIVSQLFKLVKNSEELGKVSSFFLREENKGFIFKASGKRLPNDHETYEKIITFIKKQEANTGERIKFYESLSTSSSAQIKDLLLRNSSKINEFLRIQNSDFDDLLLEKILENPKELLLAAEDSGVPLVYEIVRALPHSREEFVESFLDLMARVPELKSLVAPQVENNTILSYFLSQNISEKQLNKQVSVVIEKFVKNGFLLFKDEFSQDRNKVINRYRKVFFKDVSENQKAPFALIYATNMVKINPYTPLIDALLEENRGDEKTNISRFKSNEIVDFLSEFHLVNPQACEEKVSFKLINDLKIIPALSEKISKEFDVSSAQLLIKCVLKTSHSIYQIQEAIKLIPAQHLEEVFSGSEILHYAVKNSQYKMVDSLVSGLRDAIKNDVLFTKIINEEDKLGNTALNLAVKKCAVQTTSMLIKNGIDVRKANHEGVTPLMQAAAGNSVSMFNVLIKNAESKLKSQDFENYINQVDKRKRAALHYAAENDREDFVDNLCYKRANVSLRDDNGNTAAHVAALNGLIEIRDNLFKKRSDLRLVKNLDQKTASEIEQDLDRPFEIDKFFKLNDSPVITSNSDSKPKSLLAVALSVVSAQEAAAASDSNVSFKNLFEEAIKKSASLESFKEIFVRTKAESQPNLHLAKNSNGQNALHIACSKSNSRTLKNLLTAAKECSDQKQFEEFVNAPDNKGMTPLHYLMAQGRDKMAKVLLQHTEVKLDVQDNNGDLALHSAVRSGAANSFKLLFTEMTKRNADYRKQNLMGENVIACAVSPYDGEMFEEVKKVMCDLQMQDEMVAMINEPNSVTRQNVIQDAVAIGSDEVIRNLHQAKTSGINDIYFDPKLMDLAVAKGCDNMVLLLSEFGFKVNNISPESLSEELCIWFYRQGVRFNENEVEKVKASYPDLYYLNNQRPQLRREIETFNQNASLAFSMESVFSTQKYKILTEKIEQELPKFIDREFESKEAQQQLDYYKTHHLHLDMQEMFNNLPNTRIVAAASRSIPEGKMNELQKKFSDCDNWADTKKYLEELEKICASFVRENKDLSAISKYLPKREKIVETGYIEVPSPSLSRAAASHSDRLASAARAVSH